MIRSERSLADGEGPAEHLIGSHGVALARIHDRKVIDDDRGLGVVGVCIDNNGEVQVAKNEDLI